MYVQIPASYIRDGHVETVHRSRLRAPDYSLARGVLKSYRYVCDRYAVHLNEKQNENVMIHCATGTFVMAGYHCFIYMYSIKQHNVCIISEIIRYISREDKSIEIIIELPLTCRHSSCSRCTYTRGRGPPRTFSQTQFLPE